MFERLYIIWNLKSLYNIIVSNEEIPLRQLETIKRNIFSLGCVVIKLAQWYISNVKTNETNINHKVVNYFEDIFDNCPQHDLDYTQVMFYETFGIEMNTIYDMESLHVIGSGSIGQVYYARKLDTGLEHAIKIKHPNVDATLESFEPIINALIYAQSWRFIKNRYKLYYDFKTFFNNIKKQADFNVEAENARKFAENYKDNTMVIIPKIIWNGDGIIISEYIESVDYSSLTDYGKAMTMINLAAFIEQSILVDNFIHGDLHFKNWKVRQVNGKYIVVIFDYGLCFEGFGKDINREIWECIQTTNHDTLAKIINNYTFTVDNNNDVLQERINREIDGVLSEYRKVDFNINLIMKHIFKILSIDADIKINQIMVNFIVILNLLEDILKQNGIKYNNFDNNCEFTNNLISFCRANNVYGQLLEYTMEKYSNYRTIPKKMKLKFLDI